MQGVKQVTVTERSHAGFMGFLTVADADGHGYSLSDIACCFAHVYPGDTLMLDYVEYPADLGGWQWVWGITQAFELKGDVKVSPARVLPERRTRTRPT